MTDNARLRLLRSAEADLRKTLEGYKKNPGGIHWKNAFRKLDELKRDLSLPPVPALGPVLEGSATTMLQYSPTHNTDGVPFYPAFDAGFGQAGRWIIAPELLTVTKQSGAMGGDAIYATGKSGIDYWIGHIGTAPATGRTFRKGERIARIADQTGTDHVHWGLDTRPLTGKSLKYGRNGNGPDYSWGSPSIGKQLAAELAA